MARGQPVVLRDPESMPGDGWRVTLTNIIDVESTVTGGVGFAFAKGRASRPSFVDVRLIAASVRRG